MSEALTKSEQRVSELEGSAALESQKVRLEWSDREGNYHPSEFYRAVVACSLDHYYDRCGDGVPYGIPEELRIVFSPIVAKHLSAVNPEWEHVSILMSDEQRSAFEEELRIANEKALAPPTEPTERKP